jgi:hypothetical protein
MFRIVCKEEEKSNQIQIEYVYHVPLYKWHVFLDDQVVEKELLRCFDIVSKRVNTMLLLL